MLADRTYLHNYAIAFAAVLVALVFRFLVDPVLGDHLPYHMFYFAIAVVTAWRGLGPGLVTLAIAFVAGNFFFASPRHSVDLFGDANLLSTLRFLTIALLLVVLAHWGRTRGLEMRLHAEERERDLDRTRKEQERAQNLLASIGDGLVTVDLKGRVTYMNQVAEQLTGWTVGSAKGRSIEHVLPLVDEVTRSAVPNPALRALESGTITLLPENVALVAKDGTERTIDDSGAPIRDTQGAIIGSVLIFRDITERRKAGQLAGRLPFVVGGLQLHALDDMRHRLSTEEREQLELGCRAWIAREWALKDNGVRLVALHGFNLIIRQERSEASGNGRVTAHFSVAYERLPA